MKLFRISYMRRDIRIPRWYDYLKRPSQARQAREAAMADARSARSRASLSRIGGWVLDNSGQIRAWLSLGAVTLIGLWFALSLIGSR